LKRRSWCWSLLVSVLLLISITTANDSVRNPIDWVRTMEKETMGYNLEQGLLDRINNLELLIIGRIRDDSISQRLSYLDQVLYQNQPHAISVLYKIQALEWVLYKQCFQGALIERLERIEKLLFDVTYDGSLNVRLEKLIDQVFPNGIIKGRWITVPKDLIVKVKTINEISSTNNHSGDLFDFVVVETIKKEGQVIFPKGVSGTGVLQRVKRPNNLGIDARLILDFKQIRALDGTNVALSYGLKSKDLNRSGKLAFGASVAGMMFLGPEGILFGLIIKGKEKTIPAGTEFYIQVKEPVRIYSLTE
jgi:hypothetical protein